MNMLAGVPDPIIEARDVSKSFGSGEGAFLALDALSLSVPEGQFVTIVGPSGCGKSSLLQILAGLSPATAGEVLLNGEKMNGPRPDSVGVVFQEPWLLPWLTAAENIEFPLSLRGVSVSQRRELSKPLLALVGLKDFADRYPDELSGGMRQRVAIARALVQKPKLLLMDEPFAALDEQTRTRMGAELLHIWDESGGTVVFVTHGLTEAIYLADVIYVMAARPGRVIERIEVELPRPRTIDMIGGAYLGALRNRIWHMIADDAP